MRAIFSLLLAGIGIAITSPAIGKEPSADETEKIAEEAYVFAYPMLYNYQTLYTQTQDTTFLGYIGASTSIATTLARAHPTSTPHPAHVFPVHYYPADDSNQRLAGPKGRRAAVKWVVWLGFDLGA